ncbi:hotdog fold thioesterase [Microbacterium soli]|uniref:Thioesterase domain-containing protein n=1 Tax=Microbacterium soli TaxID=446075 RepID=A0ABP7MUS2_9MICO
MDPTGAMSPVGEEEVRARLAADAASRHMGVEITSIGDGCITLRLPPQPWMINGHGILHGGAMFWLGDTAFAFLSESRGRPAVTRQAGITYIAPLTVGDQLYATAREKARYGRNSIVDVDLLDADDALIATMTVHGTDLRERPPQV